jgi:hypothetical protein
LSAVNLTTSATTNVGEASFGSEFEGFPPTVALDGSTISWIDENGVPEAAPLPSQPNPPRFLGDPSTPASYNPSSGDWNAELDTSAALTGCSVAISSDSTPVATLPCKATDMALGDADVSWNGTATGGATVPNGSYTWTLSASNADGGVESPSGGALTLSGQVAVTSPAPYSPLTPVRICDTRKGNPSNLNGPAAQCNGNFNSGSTITPGGTRVINVATGADEIAAPADATAVVLNVTVVNPATAGHLTVYPSGAPQPLASNINFAAGQTVPNLVDVGVGTSGDVTLSSSARTDVVVDVEGYTSPTASGGSGAGLYNPLASPARICDTRAGNPSDLSSAPDNQCNNGSSGKRLSVSGTLPVQVSGDNGIPAGATAAVLNVTAANPAAQGFLTVYPTGSSRPTASNVNYSAGRASANRVVVPLSGGGGITVYSSQSSDVVVDVSGYYSDAGGSGSLSSAGSTPMRICDTRTASPLNQCTGHTITQGGILTVNAAGLAGVPATGATAVVVNLTGVDPSQQTFLTVFPQAPRPDVSDLNPAPMTVRANLVVATLSPTGTISIYNNTGSINVVVDVLGWYS